MGKWMTIDNKHNLIQQSYIKPEMTQTQLPSGLASVRLRKAPARNTVSDIIKNAAKIMKEEYGKGKRRTPLKAGLCLNRKVITRKLSG
ncbi:Homeodomain-like [Phytophthora cactorum]|nr:Homeodomain-like [Phytophthora cactorum]